MAALLTITPIVIAYVMTFADGGTRSFADRDTALELADYYLEKGIAFTLTGSGETLDTIERERLVWKHLHDGLYRATRSDGITYEIHAYGGTYAAYRRGADGLERLGVGFLAEVKAIGQGHSDALHNPTIFDPWASYPR